MPSQRPSISTSLWSIPRYEPASQHVTSRLPAVYFMIPNNLVLIGIDWADAKHDFHLVAPDGTVQTGVFAQSPEAIEQQLLSWRTDYPAATFAECHLRHPFRPQHATAERSLRSPTWRETGRPGRKQLTVPSVAHDCRQVDARGSPFFRRSLCSRI